MTRPRSFRHYALAGSLAGLVVLWAAPAALAGTVADYCRLFAKEDIEKTLSTRVTEVKPWPLKIVLGPEGARDQACVFFAGSRVLRITVTETPSPSQAQQTYESAVTGHSIMNSAEPMALPDIGDEAVLTANTVVMRRQNLVINFSIRDFANDDENRVAMAKALATKVAEKVAVAGS